MNDTVKTCDKVLEAKISIAYTVTEAKIDRGDEWHPPEWTTSIKVNDMDIDGESLPQSLKDSLIEFFEVRMLHGN